jgi:hypothetical protein
MARLADGTSLFPEDSYGGPGSADLGNPGAFAAGQALEARSYLSDDPLALTSTVRPETLGVTLFLPDLSVGRLAETSEEMATTISTFIGQDGVLDLTTSSHKVLRRVRLLQRFRYPDSRALTVWTPVRWI